MSEQHEVLGVTLRRTERPMTVLGLVAWRSLWSMGKGAGASAFMRSPVALAAAGHRVHLIQPCAAGEEGEAEYAGVRFHKYRSPEILSNPQLPLPVRLWERAWRYGYYQLTAPRRAVQLARRITPDLVVAYGIMTTPAARTTARRLGLPLAARYFGNTLSLALHKPLSWQGNFMERIGFRIPVCAMVMTNDSSPALEVFRRLGVDRRPVHFLRNGIPEETFSPGPRSPEVIDRLGVSKTAFILMCVTRLHSEKRLDRAIRALAGLHQRGMTRAVLALPGDGPEKPALERLAAELGVTDHVHFPGPVPNRALAAWYRTADVVLSLLDRTNGGNPTCEAMACGRCVVALDVGTTNEVVKDGETGVLVPPTKVDDLPRILEALAGDPDRREALGRRARPFVLELCGTVKERLEREIGILEEVAHTRAVVPGNLEG